VWKGGSDSRFCKLSIVIRSADSPEDIAAVKALFIEFSEYLGIDLEYQSFEDGLKTFPSSYDALFLACVDEAPAA